MRKRLLTEWREMYVQRLRIWGGWVRRDRGACRCRRCRWSTFHRWVRWGSAVFGSWRGRRGFRCLSRPAWVCPRSRSTFSAFRWAGWRFRCRFRGRRGRNRIFCRWWSAEFPRVCLRLRDRPAASSLSRRGVYSAWIRICFATTGGGTLNERLNTLRRRLYSSDDGLFEAAFVDGFDEGVCEYGDDALVELFVILLVAVVLVDWVEEGRCDGFDPICFDVIVPY